MAFAQVTSSQMQVRIKQSIAIYNKQILDLNEKISRLERFIPILESYMPDALTREAQTAYELEHPTGGMW